MNLKGIVFDFNGTMYIDGDKQEAAWFEFSRDMQMGSIRSDSFTK